MGEQEPDKYGEGDVHTDPGGECAVVDGEWDWREGEEAGCGC